jgi:hypothetical protein
VTCRSLSRVLTELVSKMRDMRMDKTELGCLRAIILFNPGERRPPRLSPEISADPEKATALVPSLFTPPHKPSGPHFPHPEGHTACLCVLT